VNQSTEDAFQESIPNINTLWVMSVLFVVGGLACLIMPIKNPESVETLLYLITAFSIGVILLVQGLQNFNAGLKINKRVLIWSRILLAFFAVGGFITFVAEQFSIGALMGAACLWIAIVASFQFTRRASALLFIFLFVLWQFFAPLLWWAFFDQRLFDSSFRFFIFIGSLMLSGWWIHSGNHTQKTSKIVEWIMSGAFFLLFALASTRQQLDPFHYSFFVGPVELVREGHWMLWDVPSQYGFLNLLLVSILPFNSPVVSFFVLHGVMLLVAAFLSFRLLCSTNKSLSSLIFAGTTVFVVTFLLPGWAPSLRGPTAFPSVGAFRFLWCYVLVFNCCRILQSDDQKAQVNSSLFFGTIVWTIALFWSVESGIYATCIWLPFLAIIRWGIRQQKIANYFPCALLVIRDLLFASLLPLAVFVGIWIFYKVHLGHGPDWFAYVEYGLAYQNGFGSRLIDYFGSVWTLIFVLSLLTSVAMFAIKRKSINEFAVAISALSLVWAVASYFVSRSHENNISNLLPLVVFALAAALLVVKPFQDEKQSIPIWPITIQCFLSVIFVIVSTATLGRPGIFNYLSTALLYNRSAFILHKKLPNLTDYETAELQKIGFNPRDPVAYLDETSSFPSWKNSIFFYKHMLPIAPGAEFSILSAERKKVYVERFLDRKASPTAWMLSRQFDEYPIDMISSEVLKHYKFPQEFEIPSQQADKPPLQILKFKAKDVSGVSPVLTR
jgi:hypothetical protein